MNSKEFDEVVEFRLNSIKTTLVEKAKEYASANDDRLHNFNRASSILNQSRERCLLGFATKHLVSVLDIIDNVDQNKIASEAMINEKIGDMINYLVLLEASLKDRLNNAK